MPAQNVIDNFSSPNGPVPGWKLGIPAIQDCVLDIELVYPTTKNLYFGGVTARMPASGTTGLIMTKLQDNAGGGTGAYNRIFMYERPGSSIWNNVVPPTKAAVVRMFVQGRKSWFELDGNMDGIFELKSAVKSFAASTLNTGLVGANGYNAVEMDNWKFYEGILMADPSTSPKLGTTYKMNFDAPLNGGANPRPTPWLGMLSLGNAGVPIGFGVSIPLTLDLMLINSLSFGLGGVLLPTNKRGVMSLPIPNVSALVGLKLWAAALTIGSSKPGGWGAVSNDHQFTIK